MTEHAILRIAQRVKGYTPAEVMGLITKAAQTGAFLSMRGSITGNRICELELPSGQIIFPVIGDHGAVITVLTEGMEIVTPTGKDVLRRTGLSAGLHRIGADRYHSDPCPAPSLSASLAKLLLAQSPLHAWTACPRLNPDWEPVEKKTFDIGRAAHRSILGAGSDYATIPAGLLASNGAASTKEAKVFIEECRARGLTPLKEAEIADIEAMGEKARAKLAAMDIAFDPARSELVATAEIGGVWCRSMLDNVPADPTAPIYDFKTCESAAPEACQRAVMNYGYDIQAEFYRQIWKAATGEDRAFRFVFQEKTAPFEVCVIELGEDTLMMARKKVARAREIWRICLRDNHWPGYPLGVHRIDLPEFFHARWLERESAEADFKRRVGKDVIEAAMRWQAPDHHKGASA